MLNKSYLEKGFTYSPTSLKNTDILDWSIGSCNLHANIYVCYLVLLATTLHFKNQSYEIAVYKSRCNS